MGALEGRRVVGGSPAHEAAVEATLRYLEQEVVRCRRGRNGTETVEVTGVVAAAFRHRTSRANDPLLHTHLLIANCVKAVDDGQWRTLDSRRLYRRQDRRAALPSPATARAHPPPRSGVGTSDRRPRRPGWHPPPGGRGVLAASSPLPGMNPRSVPWGQRSLAVSRWKQQAWQSRAPLLLVHSPGGLPLQQASSVALQLLRLF